MLYIITELFIKVKRSGGENNSPPSIFGYLLLL